MNNPLNTVPVVIHDIQLSYIRIGTAVLESRDENGVTWHIDVIEKYQYLCEMTQKYPEYFYVSAVYNRDNTAIDHFVFTHSAPAYSKIMEQDNVSL